AGAASLAISRPLRAADKNGKLRLASIGTGGKGAEDLKEISASPRVEVVALCNVDDSQPHLGWAAEAFPKAETFRDYRKLLDKANEFDAVSVSTPDFMHAPIALAAMSLGKHVFVQKPLAHTVHEVRLMEESAKKHKLVTQMGNQIQSHHAYRDAVQMVHDGAIGKVREVHSWQAGNMRWLIVDTLPTVGDPVPPSLKWDLWLGVAPERVYKKDLYHPQNWRGWQDFGTGQLGDFGCHILDPVFMALDLTAPTTIEAEAPPFNKWTWSPKSKIEYQFPGTDRTAGDTVMVTWYDGEGHKPEAEKLGVPKKYKLPHAGSVFVGEKGSMVLPHWSDAVLFPEEKFKEYKRPKLEDLNHYTGWAHACLGDGTTKSNFSYAGPLAETVLLGTIAIRFPKEQLLWDAGSAQFTHHADANARLTKEYRRGWELPKA
ncbi:MAG TPA: Gfo/Idh/MocA family oxidoreductase, partial [Lacipirellulaceae bacterium]|nr:Gfo/Idh/MocA family oxidoreductase [Lacipirellulaceae bacterium]